MATQMILETKKKYVTCSRCGCSSTAPRSAFYATQCISYKPIGYIPVCKNCIDTIQNIYLSQGASEKDTVRQICRKYDLYWNDTMFNGAIKAAETSGRGVLPSYLSKYNMSVHSHKCYDDTLVEEGTLWRWPNASDTVFDRERSALASEQLEDDRRSVSDEIKAFWGPGYTFDMYEELEQRRAYWMSKFPDDATIDIGTEALIRQICNLEIDINKDRAAGKAIDKNVNALNTLLGSASLRPAQKKAEDADAGLNTTPLGVWLYRYENKRPLPEVDDDLKDVNGIRKYITIWFFGHLCKMLGIKNSYSKMYEDEMERLRVERPEYRDEDDDTILSSFGSEGGGDDTT